MVFLNFFKKIKKINKLNNKRNIAVLSPDNKTINNSDNKKTNLKIFLFLKLNMKNMRKKGISLTK